MTGMSPGQDGQAGWAHKEWAQGPDSFGFFKEEEQCPS
jgi:hypothetical protein